MLPSKRARQSAADPAPDRGVRHVEESGETVTTLRHNKADTLATGLTRIKLVPSKHHKKDVVLLVRHPTKVLNQAVQHTTL